MPVCARVLKRRQPPRDLSCAVERCCVQAIYYFSIFGMRRCARCDVPISGLKLSNLRWYACAGNTESIDHLAWPITDVHILIQASVLVSMASA